MNVSIDADVAGTQTGASPEQEFGCGLTGRLEREFRTIEAMLECYCRDHHGTNSRLCSECQGLLDYAQVRLSRCRFGQAKPTCAKCPVHCYQPKRREQVKEVMRYAGPRMLWQHPVLAILHLMDGHKPVPPVPKLASGKS